MAASYSADNSAQVAFGLLDPSHGKESMEKEDRTPARSCKGPMTVTDAMFGPSLRLADGKTSGKRLRGLAGPGTVAQFGCEMQQGAKVWFRALAEQGLCRVWRKFSTAALAGGAGCQGSISLSSPGLWLFQAGHLISVSSPTAATFISFCFWSLSPKVWLLLCVGCRDTAASGCCKEQEGLAWSPGVLFQSG